MFVPASAAIFILFFENYCKDDGDQEEFVQLLKSLSSFARVINLPVILAIVAP